MKKFVIGFFVVTFLVLGANAAWAPCGIQGVVLCDVNQNGEIDNDDTPLEGVANVPSPSGGRGLG